jgi:hypothetical protein
VRTAVSMGQAPHWFVPFRSVRTSQT